MRTFVVDFVKFKFHLNENIEWICIMHLELNATQLNLNSIQFLKIKSEFHGIERNSNSMEFICN
jgi:hypothetical protein